MIDAVDHGLAFGGERGDHQRHRGAQIGRHHRRAVEALDAFDGRGLTIEMDVGAEPRQFLHVHETVLEDGLGDVRGSLGARHQRHQLRLQVGGKSGKRRGGDIDGINPGAVAGDADAFIGRRHRGAGLCQNIERRLQQFGPRILQQHVAAGHRHRHRIGAGFDPVGQHCVAGAVQFRHAVHHDARSAGAGDLGAHLVEAIGDVADLRLARRIFDHRRAIRQHRRHQRGMGAADGDLGEVDLAAAQAVFGARDHIAAFDVDLGAQRFERHDQQVDRPRADGAAARQRDLGLAHAREQRRHHPEACPHLGNELIGRGGVDDVLGGDVQSAAAVRVAAGALAGDHDVDAVIAQNALELADVGETGNIIQDQRVRGQQARDHQGQRGILRARNRDRAVEARSADYAYPIHVAPRACRIRLTGPIYGPPATLLQS